MKYSMHVAGQVKVVECLTPQRAVALAHEWAGEMGVNSAQVIVYPDTRIDDDEMDELIDSRS